MINCIAQVASFVLLLLGTLVFGIFGKPTEMGLCIAAASIGLGAVENQAQRLGGL